MRRVRAAPVEVEVVICEQHPRQVVVGTAVRLSLTTDRRVRGLSPRKRAGGKAGTPLLTATAERKWYEL